MLTERNRIAVETVNKFLTRGPVAFIGAGLSRPHFPSWSELIKQLGERLNIHPDESNSHTRQAEIFLKSNKDGYIKELINIFGDIPTKCRPGLSHLVKLNIKTCVTTNFDYSIYTAYCEQGNHPEISIYPDVYCSHCRDVNHLLFIHGAVSQKDKTITNPDHFILHESAYDRAYFNPDCSGNRSGILLRFLYDLFNLHDILFVGYGIGEDEPLRYALQAAKNRKSNTTERLLLCAEGGRPAKDISTICYDCGVRLVEYDRLDDNHSGLDEILAELFRRKVVPMPNTSLEPFHGILTTGDRK